MDFTESKADEVCAARGYSPHFVAWLHEQEMIGTYKGCVAFPVLDDKGEVVRIHYKGKDHWQYHPKGGETAPLIVGAPIAHAAEVLAFESQWDAFAMLDKLGAHLAENANKYCAYITRGASTNTNISKLAVPKIVACPQNDPPEKANKTTGRTPAEEWLFRIQGSKHKSTAFSVFDTPAPHKDANDWIRADKPTSEHVTRLVAGAENPLLRGLKTTEQIRNTDTRDDLDSLIGHKRRFLGKGGSMVIVGPSGIGKSTLMSGLTIHAAAGIAWNGISFRRPLKVLVIQAENDDGDLKEMIDGAISAVGFDEETADRAGKNILWKRVTSITGLAFCESLETLICATGADLVMVDPLLSYIGDDISQQKVASTFFRNWLQPVLDRTGAICVLVHHTGKTPSDSKSRQNWSESDFAYLGIGSSEVTNWPRAVAVLVPSGVDTGRYRFLIAKRGSRAGMVNQFTGEKTISILLKHSERGLGWVQCEAPNESEAVARGGGRKEKVSPEAVMKSLGPATHSKRKDCLVADLMLQCRASERSVREKVDALILVGRIHIAETTPRKGGGHPHDWLRAGPPSSPPSIGNNQPETSDCTNPRQSPATKTIGGETLPLGGVPSPQVAFPTTT
jgi:energy-coupling factor transporter ATP-binding protein EcfA2